MSMFILAILCLTMCNSPWLLDLTFQFLFDFFFIASDFTFTNRHIYNWPSFLLWPSLFILSGTISMLISSSVLETSHGGIIFCCHIFLPFHIVHGILEARTLEWFAFPPPVNQVLSELSTMTHPFGWPCMAWLIASLSYASPFTMTWLWSMKGQTLL